MSAPYRRPSTALLALELPRAATGAVALGPMLPILRRAPKGDGHPVLVLPGFIANDTSTRILRWFIRDRGYFVHGWRLGRNLGPRETTVTGLRERVRAIAEQHGKPMSIVGWSLGGIYAREIARAAPQGTVRQVITLGSPFRLRDRTRSNVAPLYEVFEAGSPMASYDPRPPEEELGALPVPATAVYTRTDGIAPWRSCLEVECETSESIEVRGSHAGLGHNPAVLWIIADRLAQPAGAWKPFRPKGPARMLFRRFP